jgi:hypothetical protein
MTGYPEVILKLALIGLVPPHGRDESRFPRLVKVGKDA